MKLTVTFSNIPEFKDQLTKLINDARSPFNKEFAYLIKQYSDAKDLVPRLSGNLQETASPLSPTSALFDENVAYITYPAFYSARVWYGVDFHFTTTENKNAQAKWLEPIFEDKKWITNALKKLFEKHIVKKGTEGYGKFIEKNN